MEIERQDLKKLYKLNAGDTFIHRDRIFLKTNESENNYITCVALCNGDIAEIYFDKEVIPVKTKLTILQ